MEEYQARKAREERTATRLLLSVWIAEMAWASFFAMKSVASPNTCSTTGFVRVTMFLALNYVVPLWFLVSAFGSLVIGKPLDAKAALAGGVQKITGWYKAGPTLTFVAVAFLLWTAYNVSFRYHVSMDYRDAYPDDLAQVVTTTDSLTGTTEKRVFSEEQCYEAWDVERSEEPDR